MVRAAVSFQLVPSSRTLFNLFVLFSQALDFGHHILAFIWYLIDIPRTAKRSPHLAHAFMGEVPARESPDLLHRRLFHPKRPCVVLWICLSYSGEFYKYRLPREWRWYQSRGPWRQRVRENKAKKTFQVGILLYRMKTSSHICQRIIWIDIRPRSCQDWWSDEAWVLTITLRLWCIFVGLAVLSGIADDIHPSTLSCVL